MMNMSKIQLSEKGKKRAAAGIATCFIATIALTGAYTWQNYQDKMNEELLLEEELQQAEIEETEELQQTNSEVEKADAEKEIQEVENAPEATTYTENTAATAQPNFTESSQLLWPVNGNVLMSFSMDKSIYFSTLDQYKYNPALVISGTLNDNVIAAAPGIIKSIDSLRETGTTVTVDMGNGYECLYGQLKEVKVKVGDYVEAKDVIGYISEPTKYYSVEGCNLYFEMRKDGQPVNPLDYMSEE